MTIADLRPTFGDLAQTLQKLLDYSADKESSLVEDLDLYFDVTIDKFGEKKTIELKLGGSEIGVTKQNVNEYVELYVQYLLIYSIQSQYDSFAKGFKTVISERILKLFRPEELDLLISGSTEPIQLEQLEKQLIYEGFTKQDHTIQNFWSVVKSWSPQMQRLLLKFWTGSGRIPITGFSGMNFVIQKHGQDESRLPSASTCFRVLLLPPYSSRQLLKSKLEKAIQEGNEGFGFS